MLSTVQYDLPLRYPYLGYVVALVLLIISVVVFMRYGNPDAMWVSLRGEWRKASAENVQVQDKISPTSKSESARAAGRSAKQYERESQHDDENDKPNLAVVTPRSEIPTGQLESSTAAPSELAPTEDQARSNTLVRPAALNPWRKAPPQILQSVRAELKRDGKLSRKQLTLLYNYLRQHPTDPRPMLLLGHAFAELGWRADAIRRYQRAVAADLSVRGDPQMLQNLIGMLKRVDSRSLAQGALLSIYGEEARKALKSEAERASESDQLVLNATLEALATAKRS